VSIGKTTVFVVQAVTAGLAVAFIVLLFSPQLLVPKPVVQVHESPPPTDTKTNAHLLKRDSNYGAFPGKVIEINIRWKRH